MTTTIAIDIDGVIYDIISHITDRYLPPKFKGYRPSSWNCWKEFEITKEQFFKYYSKAWHEASHDIYVATKYTYILANKLFETLHKDGYRISVITKRSKYDIINTITYLNDFGFHYDSFVTITDSVDKTWENFDVIIDDNPENLPKGQTAQLGLLVNQQWNKDYKLNKLEHRLNSLEDAIRLIHFHFPPPLQIQK